MSLREVVTLRKVELTMEKNNMQKGSSF